MTLFESQPYDPVQARKRRIRIVALSVIVLVCLILAWNFRYYAEERQVDKFFAALQKQDYETAYGIWFHDPGWKQHPQKYPDYPFSSFMQDWGPGGQWGLIKSYHVDGSAVPKGGTGTKFDVGSSGVVVVVTVNERVADKAHIWVEKSDKTLGFSPY
ncbi:MAG TPA: hypothetical protein VFB24_06710 [Candidatus Binatia bacterium]|nr:hypothetical protein [Candidatus Binatia bacterium]